MKYTLSTIADLDYVTEDGCDRLIYRRHTAPVAVAYGVGLELAEFCIAENLDESFEAVREHLSYNSSAVADKVLHAPYNELMPHAIEPGVVKVAADRYDQAWRMALRYGCTKMIVHANFVPLWYFPVWFTARQAEFWKRFLGEHPDDVTVCLENVLEDRPELILDILEKVDDPRLRMCLDVGHANLTSVDPMDWLTAGAPYISHYHIHNNQGELIPGRPSAGDRHAALPDGTIDMETLLRRAEELTPGTTAAVESSDIEKSCAWLREKGFIA